MFLIREKLAPYYSAFFLNFLQHKIKEFAGLILRRAISCRPTLKFPRDARKAAKPSIVSFNVAFPLLRQTHQVKLVQQLIEVYLFWLSGTEGLDRRHLATRVTCRTQLIQQPFLQRLVRPVLRYPIAPDRKVFVDIKTLLLRPPIPTTPAGIKTSIPEIIIPAGRLQQLPVPLVKILDPGHLIFHPRRFSRPGQGSAGVPPAAEFLGSRKADCR